MTISHDKSLPVQSDAADHQYPDPELLGMHDALVRPAIAAHPVDLADPHGASSALGDLTSEIVVLPNPHRPQGLPELQLTRVSYDDRHDAALDA